MSDILTELDLDTTNPSLRDTAKRISKMYTEEIFSSLNAKPPSFTTFPNEGYDEIIMLDNIPFTSVCEHHFVFFSGHAFFLYVPDKKIIGASKVARMINFFSNKPQIQERLTQEIIDHFCLVVEPKGAMLVMRGIHGCMAHRGVKTGLEAGMMTSAVRGVFKSDPSTKAEGLELIRMSMMDRM